jgi:heme-degrading monooxygenase HmoA
MPETILRRWAAKIRTADAGTYRDYISGTGGSDYTNTPGNRGYRMLMRDLDDGTTEVVTESLWESLDAIKAFAGDDITLARYYPEDDRFLLERPAHVSHYRIVDRGF